jgi:AraC-like DNA-binding protein
VDSRLYQYYNFMNDVFPFKIERRNNHNITREMHSHDYLQICYVWKGTCIHSVYEQNCVAVKGDIFAILPSVPHTMESIESKEIELVQVDFMPFFINESMREFSKIESFVDFAYIQPMIFLKDSMVPRLNLSSAGQSIVENLMHNMERELDNREEGFNLAVKADLLKLLVILGREFRDFMQHKKQEDTVVYHRKLFFKTIEYIDNNYNQEIKLEDMAKMSAMSPSYYSNIFKVIQGSNFVKYLNEVRIRNAVELLKITDMNISEVCFRVGFNNLGHFNKVFKEFIGVTPSSFRKIK